MTEKTVEKESYRLSESKRKDLISGLKDTVSEEDNEALSNFSKQLELAKRNAESQDAWISAIIPPGVDNEDAPNRGNQIAVQFMLPSEDTFWETYEISKSYISDDNEFVELVNHVGYDVNALEYVIGQKVKVVYDQESDEWILNPDIFTDSAESDNTSIKKLLTYAVGGILALMVSIPLTVVAIRTRGLILIPIIIVLAVIYFVDQNFISDD